MCCALSFSVYSLYLNVLRRKGLNNNRVVQYVFDFFTFLSSLFNLLHQRLNVIRITQKPVRFRSDASGRSELLTISYIAAMKRLIFYVVLSLAGLSARAQDLFSARKTLDTLTSPAMWGRGYTREGMKKAADYLVRQFVSYGLHPMQPAAGKEAAFAYKQPFYLSVNTFPGRMKVMINGRALQPGVDFIISPESIGQKSKGPLQQRDSVTYISPQHRIVLELKNKLTWSVAQDKADYTLIQINKKSLPEKPERIEIDIENQFIESFEAYNICGIVPGTVKPDSLIVITAHYDHLGGMGSSTYFPGANDNASGVSLLLSLARHYAANPAPYSIAFICFGAEEAGIVGSKYFTEHPLTDLQKIRFLLNVDLVGTGETGITVVNATLHPNEFELLNKINDAKKYLVKINPRGKAANSDHYFFTEKGVPAFFIYTQGGISAYHDIFDKASTLPLTEFEDLFRLFTDFNQSLMGR